MSKKTSKIVTAIIIAIALIFVVAAVLVFFLVVKPNLNKEELETSVIPSLENVWDENSYDKQIQDNVDNEDKTDPTYIWSAHATSVLAYADGGDPNLITGTDIYYRHDADANAYLEEEWGINDRSSAKETIMREAQNGHREKYLKYISGNSVVSQTAEAIETDFGEDISYELTDRIDTSYLVTKGISTDEPYKVIGAACAKLRFGYKGLDGYDCLTLIKLTYTCYKCGFISNSEYIEILDILNTVLRREFNDYKEIHESYYYGEMFRLAEMTNSGETTLKGLRGAIDKIESDSYYETINTDFAPINAPEEALPAENEEGTEGAPAEGSKEPEGSENTDGENEALAEGGEGESGAEGGEEQTVGAEESGDSQNAVAGLSDNLEDYTFEIDGKFYKLPLSYNEIVEGGFTPDTAGDYMVPAGEEFFFKGDYLGNEYSTLDFGVYNSSNQAVALQDIPIILVNGNQFRWNQYEKYSYKVANGFTLWDNTIEEVEAKYGPLTIPEDNMEDALGTTLYYYEYNFESGWYRFLAQPSGKLAGIRMCKYLND